MHRTSFNICANHTVSLLTSAYFSAAITSSPSRASVPNLLSNSLGNTVTSEASSNTYEKSQRPVFDFGPAFTYSFADPPKRRSKPPKQNPPPMPTNPNRAQMLRATAQLHPHPSRRRGSPRARAEYKSPTSGPGKRRRRCLSSRKSFPAVRYRCVVLTPPRRVCGPDRSGPLDLVRVEGSGCRGFGPILGRRKGVQVRDSMFLLAAFSSHISTARIAYERAQKSSRSSSAPNSRAVWMASSPSNRKSRAPRHP